MKLVFGHKCASCQKAPLLKDLDVGKMDFDHAVGVLPLDDPRVEASAIAYERAHQRYVRECKTIESSCPAVTGFDLVEIPWSEKLVYAYGELTLVRYKW